MVGVAAESGPSEIDAAVHHATATFDQWRCTPVSERSAVLLRVGEALTTQRERLALLMAEEIGKPFVLGLAEIDRAALTFRLSAELGPQLERRAGQLEPDARAASYASEFWREPLGVVLAIAPYNWPFNLAAHKLGPALMAGNTVVMKGSPQASLCSLALARLIQECGLPAGVLNTVNCENDLASRLVLHEGIAAVSFTGSDRVGWHIRAQRPHIPVTLELGGNAFALIDEDADLDQAASRLVPSAFSYAGQVCISLQNILVHESRYEALVAKLQEATKPIRVSDPKEVGPICGPVISLQAAERLGALLEDAERHAAKIVRFEDHTGNRIPPTLCLNPPVDHPIVCEEVFGPVLNILTYGDFDLAVEIVNRSRYGIHTSYFGNRQDIVERLRTPGVVIGDAPSVRFDSLPYGGEKQSGVGREGPLFALDGFTSWRTCVRRLD